MNIFKNYIRLWMLLIASVMSCAAIAQDENYGIGDGFDPANPGNPGSNGWNAATGEVIIDDFTTGNLNNTITKKIGNSDNDAVTQIVVAGVINDTDFRVGNNYAKCTLVDFSRTAGISSVPSSAYSGNTHLCSIMLPTSITDIGSNAFKGCSALTAMTCYTLTPPKVGSNALNGVADNMIVYVPSEAVDRYQEADVWKDYTILPIQETVHSLTVNMPSDIDLGAFKNMTLELVNAKSGQSYRYIITDKASYVFNNLIENTVYKAYVKNSLNNIFGETDEVSVNDTDAEVTFASLSIPQNVNLSIMAGGNDITSQATVTWTDSIGNYLSQGSSLTGYAIGKKLNYTITLPQNIVMEYAVPNTTQYVVADGGNNIVCTLSPLQKVVVTGKVLDLTTKSAISGAVVSASQTFGGKYSKTTNVKTDSKGQYSIEVFRVPTSLAIAASDYVSQTVECDVVNAEGEAVSVADVSLKSISGAVISIDFTYKKCPNNAGEEGEVESFYSDYNNVDYTIFNKTQNRSIGQFNVQYPQIVLLEEVNENDILEITASSRTSAFTPIVSSAIIDSEQRAYATFDIVELGKLKSSFTANTNTSVVGSLYDTKGKLIKTYDYSGNSLTVSGLADGNYTLVTMGSSRLFNTIYDLNQLPQTGLTNGVDYAQNSVSIKSGELSIISIAEVPTLDESKLFYTGDNTSFTVNKPSIVAGNYLTLTGHIDFKSAYSTKVSNVNLIVDLPESCSFVENSVMVGNSISSYTLNGNRLTIPIARYTDRVRFCVIPTLGGNYAPSALAQFEIEGETITQPIGSAHYRAEDLFITVPSTVSKTAIPVSGAAIGASDIEIYDNGVLIGQTKSLANGTWDTTCELNNPFNLSMHTIYAKILTKSGIELISETENVTYDMNNVVPEKVTILYYNPEFEKQYNIVFDLTNGTVSPSSYYFFPYKSWPNWRGSGTEPKDFTFIADLSNNDTTVVSEVTIRAYTDKGNWRNLKAKYNSSINKWMAISSFESYELPIGVDVVIKARAELIADRKEVDENLSVSNDLFSELSENMNNINELISANIEEETAEKSTILANFIASDNYDASAVDNWIKSVMNQQDSTNSITDSMAEELTKQFMKESEEFSLNLINNPDSSIYALLHLPYDLESITPTLDDASFEFRGYKYEQKKIIPTTIDNLVDEGFSYYNLTDSSRVYFMYENSGIRIIDADKFIEYSMMPVNSKGLIRQLSMPYKASNAGFKQCVNDWSELVANIVKYKDAEWNLDLKNVVFVASQVCGTIKNIINASSCFYNGYYIELSSQLENGYKNLIKNFDDKIEAGRKLIDSHWERIMVQNDMINQQEDMIRQYNKNIDAFYAQALNTSDPDILKELEKQIDYNQDLIRASEDHIKLNKKIISDINKNDINLIEKQLGVLAKGREGVEKGYKLAKEAMNEFPSTLAKGKKVTVWTKIGKLAGTLGILADVIDIFSTGCDALDEINEWNDLGEAMLRILPCEGDKNNAESLCLEIRNNFIGVITAYTSILGTKVSAAALNTVDVPVFSPHWWIASGLGIYAEWANLLLISNKYIPLRGDLWTRMAELKCQKDNDKCPICGKEQCECKNKCTICGKIPCVCKPPQPQLTPIQDPSGYVYEGVFSNRLEGVTATCYYKETIEDMYGDKHENIVKWDAAEYAQENPLFTDENGYYRWDVPQGLWQVKFEKEGYETTYSEWLPVPPPQLDINIAMKQNVQPTVKTARAFEDAVEMEFDKYMMPELLTSDNIRVMAGDNAVEGTVELLNEEVSYDGNEEKFASKVRFNAAAPFDATEVTLMVSNRVKSYAGIRMQDDFSQTFTIEPEVQKIVCDAEATVEYGGQGELTVQVLPAVASAGKTLKVKSSSAMILSTDVEELTLDSDGKASLKIGGELPGAAAITYTVDGYDLSATTMVNVEQVQLVPEKPLASIASGSALLKGTQITLSCPTSSAEIYYTTDGSCPCDAGAKKYDGTPITISEGTTLKIMAVGKKGDESEIVTYTYTLRQTNLNVPLAKGWNWVSHNQDDALTSDKLEMDNVDRVLTQIGELYRDPKIGFTGHIDDVNATDAFKVHTTDAGNLQLGGVMYNPYFSPVELKRGWNWLGYPLEKEVTVDDAFSFMESEADDYIVNLEGGFAQFDGDKWTGTLETLSPGQGYLFKSASDKELAYNIFAAAAPSANSASEIPSDDMPWQYDSHAYPNVMCVTADLYVKDVKAVAGEYLVGAFVDGECRGIGRYVDNTLFLSVHGDKNVEVTLLAMDNESGVVYDITEKLMFTPDVVGTVSMPYPLHLGSPTGISHLTMDNSGFKSIHNVLGQKVKSIDGGGVFIIDGRKRVVTKRNEQEYLK